MTPPRKDPSEGPSDPDGPENPAPERTDGPRPARGPDRSRDTSLDLVQALQAGKAEALGSSPVEGNPGGRLFKLALLVAAVGGGTLLALNALAPAPPPPRQFEVPPPSAPIEGLRSFEEVERSLALARADAGAASLDGSTETPGAVVPPLSPKGKAAPALTQGRLGELTLITAPDCEVHLGAHRLGRTPLLKVSLPEGTHSLVLIGPDKKPRRLDVPIRSEEPISFRLELSAIPER